jgi:hypothetical protein
MLKTLADFGPLASTIVVIGAVALAYAARYTRQIVFVLAVAGAVASALSTKRRNNRPLVIRIGEVGSLTFRS